MALRLSSSPRVRIRGSRAGSLMVPCASKPPWPMSCWISSARRRNGRILNPRARAAIASSSKARPCKWMKPGLARALPLDVDLVSTTVAQHAQEVMEVSSQMHTTVAQAESCLQNYGGIQQLTAPGLADAPSLGTAVRRPGDNELLDRAVCLSTPAEQVEEPLQEDLVVLEEGSSTIAGTILEAEISSVASVDLLDAAEASDTFQASRNTLWRRLPQALEYGKCLMVICFSLAAASLARLIRGSSSSHE